MNLLDYLDWRGDLSFDAAPVNEIDALIFAWLSYYPFEALGENPDGLTLGEVVRRHENKFGAITKVNPATTIDPAQTAVWLLKRAADVPRFSRLHLADFRSVTDAEQGVQFAALSFLLETGLRVVAYRGTDSTLAGWKEDCYLAISTAVPAQTLAAQYLEETTDGREVLVCGHSKGGNLAMYAALQADEERSRQVRLVYNFDGPGFNFELEKHPRYGQLREKVITIVPASSVVGMLLNHERDYQVVASQMASLLQHDAMFWQVLGPHFVYAEQRNASSRIIDATLSEWIEGMSMDERKQFVDSVFSILEGTGARTLTELPEKIAQSGLRSLSQASLKPQQKRMVLRLLMNLMRVGNAKLYDSVVHSEAVTELTKRIADGGNQLAGSLDALASRFSAGQRRPVAEVTGADAEGE